MSNGVIVAIQIDVVNPNRQAIMQKVASLEKIVASLVAFIPTAKMNAINQEFRRLKTHAAQPCGISFWLVKIGHDTFYNLIPGVFNCRPDS